MNTLTELGICVGYLAQASAWVKRLDGILSGQEDWDDEVVATATACLVNHIPLVREKLIEIGEEERNRILEAR